MNEFFDKAIEKLSDLKSVSGRKQNVMKADVSDALQYFCKEEPEFAQAVAQGGSFKECMDYIANGTGNSVADKDAFKKAVEFYFPGAKISFTMTIDLIGDAKQEDKPIIATTKHSLSFSMDDFL